MDDISDIISIMSERDRNNFLRFINVEKDKTARDDQQIFENLVKGEEKKKKLSSKKEKDAYHQNRKRLMEKLIDYYVLKSRKEDLTGESKTMGLITMSKFLFEGKMNRLGWKILRKAEKHAWESDQYGLLNAIYLMMIEHADSFHATDIKTLIRKKTEAYNKSIAEESVIMATQIIKLKLHEAKTKGKSLNFNTYLESILKKFKISSTVFENPKHLYSIIQVIRSSYLASRSLYNFEGFALEQYNTLQKKFGFKKQHHQYKIELEYMIAHVLYRNRKYNESLAFLREMYASMNEYGKLHYRAYYPKYIALHASVKCFTGKITEAIASHEKILFKQRVPLTIKDELNLHMNLAVFYHFNKQFNKTTQIFNSQHHRDEWMEGKMGREFVMRKNLARALHLYDVKREDEGLEVLYEIKKHYADQLELAPYKKVAGYLDHCILYFLNPDDERIKKFVQQVEKSTNNLTSLDEENKTIAFFCWLLAKVKKMDYYKLTLSMVKSSTAN